MPKRGAEERVIRRLPPLVPFPREVKLLGSQVILDPFAEIQVPSKADDKERIAMEQIRQKFSELTDGKGKLLVRLGSLKTVGDPKDWPLRARQRLAKVQSDQGYFMRVERGLITILGKSSLGTLYGVQTLLQLVGREGNHIVCPSLEVIDYPQVEQRFLAPAMSWYAGYGRIGFSSQLWGWEQWKRFIDWCLLHKINGLNVCIYGCYPFRFDEYPESVLQDIQMRTWVNEMNGEATIRYTHPNVKDEFLPEMIRYANARGITVLCYFGLNTFNGGYALAHPESRYYSTNQEKYRQFKYNLCPSREDTRKYLEASVRRLLSLGFNGMVLEESEGSGFCECQRCIATYYDEEMESRKALHRADYELFNRLYGLIKGVNPNAIIGVRMWRMGSEMGVDYLRENMDKIPPDTLIFWSNGIDPEKFKGWVDVFGPDRIMGQDAELLGFSALYAGLIYMVPEQFSSYVKYVDPNFKPSYPQTLFNDIRQYRQAAKNGCKGVTGYAFTWNGWEIAPLSLAQFGWNPDDFEAETFIDYGYSHLFGKVVGRLIGRATMGLPIVLETRICEVDVSVPREDPVSAGLGALTSLQIPTKFGEGEREIRALNEDLRKAKKSLALVQRALKINDNPLNTLSMEYLENAAERTVKICKAAIEYRVALKLERSGSAGRVIVAHLQSSLDNLTDDYLILKQNAFDLTEEFHERITKAIEIIQNRLDSWRKKKL